MTEVVVSKGEQAWAESAASWIAQRLARALEERDTAVLALAGGTTPAPVYRALVERHAELDWPRVQLLLGDERCVPPDDTEANARLAWEAFVRPLGARAPILRLPQGIEHDAEAAAEAYEQFVPEAVDVVLLGIGEDGHVASLFPGFPALAERERRVVAVVGAPKPPPRRISLTPRVFAEARAVAVLARGAGKAEMVCAALIEEGPLEELPARLAKEGTWFLDEAAARLWSAARR